MKTIELTQEKVAIVDDEDYEHLNQFKWYFHNVGYAARTIYNNGKQGIVLMHRLINDTLEGLDTDHINHIKLDNRKDNLRTVTRSENQHNRLKNKKGSSIYKGVCWYGALNKWSAYIRVNGNKIHLGYSDNEKDMAIAYNKAAIKYHGGFAMLNDI